MKKQKIGLNFKKKRKLCLVELQILEKIPLMKKVHILRKINKYELELIILMM